MRLAVLTTLLFTGIAIAAPLSDLSVTSVDLEEKPLNANGGESLLVTVTRVDDLVGDDGSIIAERVMAVKVTFDVLNNQLHCNGVPIEVGVSNIQVEAQIAPNADKLQVTSEEDAAILEDSFDIGLAAVEVTVMLLDESTLNDDDGISFRRFAVKERITEVNGEQVVHSETGQQIIDVFENGKLERWAIDPLTGFLLPGPAIIAEQEQSPEEPKLLPSAETPEHAVNKNCVGALVDSVVNWWNEQHSGIQGIMAGAICALLFAIVMGIRRLAITRSKYDIVATSPSDENRPTEKVFTKEEDEERRSFLS
ncbi:hypothetical protein BX666DRAFT_1906147 [Dichotomocladium elegans]|nr:hypothetical protein BX666DRAFT_1906147 [Dichotomocladium elegans]